MDPLLVTALEAAEAAAAVHLRHFGEVGLEGAKEKGQSDFVSLVDLEAQEAVLNVVRRRHPDHAVLAEEEPEEGLENPSEAGEESSPGGGARDGTRGMSDDQADFLWIVDPLDGTTNYLHRHPHFAASVGVARRSHEPEGEADTAVLFRLEAGAVVAPRTGERWWARRGQGAFKNGLRIRVSPLQSLGKALVGTGFPFKAPELLPRYLQQFQRVLPASGGIRRAGSAALDLCYVAEGILDAFWEEAYLSPWDVAAGLIILREAGGTAARLDGSEVDLEKGSILAAGSRNLFQELQEVVLGPARDQPSP